MISFGLMLLREALDLLEVDQIVVAPNAILDGVEPFAAHRRLGAVGEVAAGVEAHAQDRVAGLGQRQHHRAVRLRAECGCTLAKPQPNNCFARSIASVSTASEGAQP